MLKLLFYWGPGDVVTKVIRKLTRGPYSHVELQFTDGCRFFSSGHGIHKGAHMICDRKLYGPFWDQVLIPATQEQEDEAARFLLHLIGIPFDWRGLLTFMIPFFDSHRKAAYCSSVVLDVLQQSLHMFPGAQAKVSPNGLHRLFVAEHPLLVSPPPQDDTHASEQPLVICSPLVICAPDEDALGISRDLAALSAFGDSVPTAPPDPQPSLLEAQSVDHGAEVQPDQRWPF